MDTAATLTGLSSFFMPSPHTEIMLHSSINFHCRNGSRRRRVPVREVWPEIARTKAQVSALRVSIKMELGFELESNR